MRCAMTDKDELWEKVVKDFPRDPALQEVHYARLKIHEQTQGMSREELVEFIKRQAKSRHPKAKQPGD